MGKKSGFPFSEVIIARVTPQDAGFVDIFIGQIHNENDDQIQ